LDTNRQSSNRDDQALPHNIEAEQSILGAILLDPTAFEIVADEMQINEFYASEHRKIYKCMVELSQENNPIDLITLTERLDIKGWLVEVGNVTYLAQLSNSVPTAANIKYYMNIVQDKYKQRQVMETAKEMFDSVVQGIDVSQAVTEAQSKLDNLNDGLSTKKSIKKIAEIMMGCFEDIEQRSANLDGSGVTGIPSGYDDLDRMTAGFQNSDFIVVGARPSVGKTAFALNIGRNAARIANKGVAIFSLEMSERQLGSRMISAEMNIDAGRIRTGHLACDDWEKLTMAVSLLSEYPIYIDDTPGITVPEIRAKCRKLKKDEGIGMILIDYLQLIEAAHRSGINRQQEISEITRSLKQLAKELDIPVIALSQLSRGVEQRQDKRPMMSDLRESGSIEQDADIVAFLYRDDYYNKESEKEGIIEVIIAKQRNGATGTVELAFLKNYNKFVSLDRSSQREPEPEKVNFTKPDMHRRNNSSYYRR
jgi:replicative DNA helicase